MLPESVTAASDQQISADGSVWLPLMTVEILDFDSLHLINVSAHSMYKKKEGSMVRSCRYIVLNFKISVTMLSSIRSRDFPVIIP